MTHDHSFHVGKCGHQKGRSPCLWGRPVIVDFSSFLIDIDLLVAYVGDDEEDEDDDSRLLFLWLWLLVSFFLVCLWLLPFLGAPVPERW